MNKTLRTKGSNINIISFMGILGLFVLLMSGCQQVNDLVNSNKATNTNTTADKANSSANSNTSANTANSNPAQTAPVDNLKTDNVEKTSSSTPQSENGGTESNELKTTEIQFVETTFEFGSIYEGEIFTHEFKLKNTGTSPLVITDGKGSCQCVTVDFPKEPIPPGGMSKIAVRFDSKTKTGNRNQKVTITANTNPPQNFLYLTGEVRGQ